ncbi:hypothetical protein C7S18_23175 [Ahniella affigens]|uniref:Uncharacterized protein n=1 Tax=Ahniella affigens TaxID=2021234 RepID=A0A2P1PYJ5_9GAMM|nr:hypothetical protein C7S18_23175 [Ahniella affigens]
MVADSVANREAGRLLCFWLPLRSGLRALPWLVLTIGNILGRAFGVHTRESSGSPRCKTAAAPTCRK